MNEPHERAQIFKDRAKIGAHLEETGRPGEPL